MISGSAIHPMLKAVSSAPDVAGSQDNDDLYL
jgi:hypothetical protein